MNKLRLEFLYRQYINDDCTPQELQELKSLLKNPDNEKHIIKLLDGTWDGMAKTDLVNVDGVKADNIYHNIIKMPQYKRAFKNCWLQIAASIILFFSIGTGFYLSNKSHNEKIVKYTVKTILTTPADVMPGSNKAVLTLANGKRVILDDAKNGKIAQQAGTTINKVQGGELVYASNLTQEESLTPIEINTIDIPRGGQYSIVLPDGTRVYLNSESSLQYPVKFVGNERKVKLTGEAYFEVAKNAKMPFRVNVSDKQTVEVLGTHFNISAYKDESTVKTTLLEGSVKILYRDKEALLKPGQIAVNNYFSSEFNIHQANINEIMAWRNGVFVFNDENIVSLMKRVSRWYDIDVTFKGDMSNINIIGNYSRGKTLSGLLKNIQLTNKVHFVIEGRRVSVIAQ
jgi:transmembrane sensor